MLTRDLQYTHHQTCSQCIESIRSNYWLREGWNRWRQNNPELITESIKQKREAYWNELKQNPERRIRDIQARVEGSRRWRSRHPEVFKANLERARSHRKTSKMETWLRTSGTLPWPSAQIRCGDQRKQVDFVSPDHKIWVEVDGSFHFVDFAPKKSAKASLANVQARDAMLNREARARGNVTLIRMDASCFCGRERRLTSAWAEWLIAMLRSPVPGIWCCGKSYKSVPWDHEGCTILKLLTPSTTSSSLTEL